MDNSVFRWFNQLQVDTPALHGVASFYAVWGIAAFGILLLAAWWDARSAEEPQRAVAAVAWAGIAPLIGALAVQLIGSAVDRARPTAVLSGTHLLLEKTTDFSFPSDHGTATAAMAVALIMAGPFLRRRWYGWVGLGLAVLMAVTRVYVGAHYPTDVLAGLALGSVIAAALARPARAALTPVAAWLTRGPLRPLIAAGGTT